MPPIPTTEARDRFSELLNRAAFGKERVVLTRRGKQLVALVPIEDLAILESLEDAADAAEIAARTQAWEEAGRPVVGLEDVIRKRASAKRPPGKRARAA